MAPAAELVGIQKRFGAVVALADVSLRVEPGEVLALAGENGAGKSTLMKVLAGVVTPDAGQVSIGGLPLHPHRPERAIALGLGMVYQHFMLVDTLTVAENLVLGREPRRGPAFDRRRAEAETAELSARYGLSVDPRARVEDCPVGVQQRVELLKVLARDARVIVLDEPTAILTPLEVEDLLAVIRKLRDSGRAVILISHKLRELLAVADRVMVLRHGRVTGSFQAADTTPEALSAAMMGQVIHAPRRAPGGTAPGMPRLSLADLRVRSDRGAVAIEGLTLEVRAGEIVGVAGVEGNGQTELVEAIVGLRTPERGEVRVDGQALAPGRVDERQRAGLATIPEDRHAHGVVLEQPVFENAILGRERAFTRLGHLERRRIRAEAERLIATGHVSPPNPDARLGALSGGNQQKLVIARALSGEPCVVVAAHPTRGLDVGAMAEVDTALLAARARGAAVLLVSAELAELLAIADRIVVLYRGRVVLEVAGDAADEAALGLAMSGGGP